MMLGGCALGCPPIGSWPTAGSDEHRSERSTELEKVLERARREHKLPGLAAAVVHGTREIVSGVTGRRRWRGRSRMQLEDRFHIASCTKAWTATLAAIAVN